MEFIKRLSPKTVGISAALITLIIWTAFIVIARASAQRTLTPFDIALARLVGAAVVLLPWGWWLVRRDVQRSPEGKACPSSLFGLSPLSFRVSASMGFFGGFLHAAIANGGFVYAPAAHASVLMPGSLPLWTTLLSMWILGSRITPARWFGLLLILLGDFLVGGASLLQAWDGGEVWKGDLLFIAGALCWSAYSVLARRYQVDPVRATIAITVFGVFSYIPVYAVLVFNQWLQSQIGEAPLGDFLFQMVFQGLFSVVISGITFTKMIQYFGPVRSTMITALVPGLSALGAVIFLGEPLSWGLLLGLALVTMGIVFGVRSSLPATASAPT